MATAITDIPGIGPVAAAALAEHGYPNLRKLAASTAEKLAGVPGFSLVRATKVIAAARALLSGKTGDTQAERDAKKKADKTKGGKHKRDKKKKKDKRAKKGKDKKRKKDKKDKKDKKRKKGKKRRK